MRVLVTYGKHPKTLAAVRSLGKAGKQVFVTDDLKGTLSSYSKYCHKFTVTASPLQNPSRFRDELESLVRNEGIDLVVPMDDPECDLLVNGMNAKMKLGIAIPRKEIYEIARDKNKTIELARKLSLTVPRTMAVRDVNGLRDAIEYTGLPAVVKPLRSSGSRGFSVLSQKSDVDLNAARFENYGPLLAQEFIPHGGAVGVSCLLNKGETRATFAHRRLLEFPETGGASIVSESINHSEAEVAGGTLLEKIGWHGVAMVEFRLDARNGKPVLMEINPRFWGTLQLAISAGVDFPNLLCDMYEKGDIPSIKDYRTGLTCVSLLPRGIASALAAGGASRLLRTLRYATKSRCFYVESFDDPLPAIGSVMELLSMGMNPEMRQGFFRRDA